MSTLTGAEPFEMRTKIFEFLEPCPRTKSGYHLMETLDDFNEPLPAPWCRQCGAEAALIEEPRGDA